ERLVDLGLAAAHVELPARDEDHAGGDLDLGAARLGTLALALAGVGRLASIRMGTEVASLAALGDARSEGQKPYRRQHADDDHTKADAHEQAVAIAAVGQHRGVVVVLWRRRRGAWSWAGLVEANRAAGLWSRRGVVAEDGLAIGGRYLAV